LQKTKKSKKLEPLNRPNGYKNYELPIWSKVKENYILLIFMVIKEEVLFAGRNFG